MLLLPRLRVLQVVVLGMLVVSLGLESSVDHVSWSPYYKIGAKPAGRSTLISVNGIPHQDATPVDEINASSPYRLPYARSKAPLDDVLIIGAGSGTDVALALDAGARRIDAVEIDPRIQQIGEQRHPDRPYDDPRVSVHIEDGRAFLERTDAKYDLILFALPDSLTLVSGHSSLRLESYLFTTQAMEAARRRLKPGGAFAMYNFYREPWLVDRLAGTLQEVYGRAPCVDVLGTTNSPRGHHGRKAQLGRRLSA